MFSYNPLWKTLVDRNMNKTNLLKLAKITNQTLADMGKNKYVSMQTLDKICTTLHCNIDNVIEHRPNNE